MQFIWNLLRGAVIGIANVIPGVSGGTMAVVLNIYDTLIGSVSRFFRDWKKNLLFLIPIVLGAGAGILLFSKLVDTLLLQFPTAVNFFFLGLIVGSIPLIAKRAFQGGFRPVHLVPCVLALGLMLALAFFAPASDVGAAVGALDAASFLKLLVSGLIAAVAMLLPGVSGSMMLMIFGVYFTVINAVSTFNIPLLLPVGIGVVLGLLGGAKLIDIFLRRFPQATFWAVLGLILGSLVPVWRQAGFTFTLEGLVAVLLLFVGAGVALLLGSDKLAGKKKRGEAYPAIEEPPASPEV